MFHVISLWSSRIIASFIITSLLTARSIRHGSLAFNAAITAWIVGFFSVLAGNRFTVGLLMFFFSSSFITRIGAKRKISIEDGYAYNSRRTAIQVVCNASVATVIAIIHIIYVGMEQPDVNFHEQPIASTLVVAYLGAYACCNGDTWSSELGVLATSMPRLITHPWRRVPAGTNGGVSFHGTLAAIIGGGAVGMAMCIVTPWNIQWRLIPLASTAGLFGSMVDSFMGATLQASYWCSSKKKVVSYSEGTQHICGFDALDNHMVNFISSLITACVTVLVGYVLLE